MISKKSIYTCTKCGKRKRAKPGQVHVCCRTEMVELQGMITK